MSLLPSSPDISPDGEPRVVGLDSEEADDLMAALSSGTARRILSALHEDPAPPGELAERVDTSLQNAQYHLERLEGAGAVEVVGTAYSEKGREMSVYGPADRPLVIFAGEKERASGLRAAISRLFGGFLALAAAAVAVQGFFGDVGDEPTPASTGEGAVEEEGDVGAFDAPSEPSEPTPTGGGESADAAEEAAPEAVEWLASALDGLFGAGLSPGLAFFLGGAIVLTVVVGASYLRTRA
mgnify:CR=1 FL=1